MFYKQPGPDVKFL